MLIQLKPEYNKSDVIVSCIAATKEYFNINCKSSKNKTKKAIIVCCKLENITKYYTLSPIEKTYKYLLGDFQMNFNLIPGQYIKPCTLFIYYDWIIENKITVNEINTC